MAQPRVEVSYFLKPRFDDVTGDRRLLVARLVVGLDIAWDMLPYPTAAQSCVTRSAYRDYAARYGLLAPLPRSLLIEDLSIRRQPVPPLRVVPSLAPERLGVDGFLGFDFFSQFQVVEWHPNTGFMRLQYP